MNLDFEYNRREKSCWEVNRLKATLLARVAKSAWGLFVPAQSYPDPQLYGAEKGRCGDISQKGSVFNCWEHHWTVKGAWVSGVDFETHIKVQFLLWHYHNLSIKIEIEEDKTGKLGKRTTREG